jgi:hypothetical protein
VKGRDVGFQTTKEGEFWRILLPGIYTMEVFADGFQPREVQFAVIEQNPTLLNITLYRETSRRSDAQVPGSAAAASAPVPVGVKPDEKVAEDLKSGASSEDQESTFFGFPNPISKLRSSVQSLLDKVPIIG